MCPDSFFETKDLSKNELSHVLLIGGTHNKQGLKDTSVWIVILLTLSLIKSHKYPGAVLFTALCVKSKKKKNLSWIPMALSQNGGDVVTPWDTF